MLARLRENLSFKLLALAVAIMLHMYVASQQNPSQTHSVTIPSITIKDLPEGLLMTTKPGPIIVSLTGTSEELSRIGDMPVTASVDLRHARAGSNDNLPIDVELAPSGQHAGVSISDKPRTISLDLVERRKRRIAVAVQVSGASAAGFIARKPSLLVPSMATATGPADEVDSIARLVVKPDVTGATDTVDDDYQIIPIDAEGNDVANVQIFPETAHVQIGIVEAGRTKEVFITPSIIGTPAPGYMIGGVVTKPATAILSGSIDRLSAASSVATDPIDIQGASADVTRQARCVAPTGATLSSAPTVIATIRIVPTAPAPIPAPAQAVPAAPIAH